MADYKLLGHNYQTPDIVAKVTGKAKYAEDFRADGMLFCKLLLSQMPHARVRHIDASAALKMPGVHAVLTEDDLPNPAGASLGEGVTTQANAPIKPEMVLSNEPRYFGEPILAVVADSELIAAEAIEKIVVDLEPLPFAVDPIEALRPGSPNARTEGNVWVGQNVETIKFTEAEWKEVEAGRLPFRDVPKADQFEIGSVEEGFKQADLIVDETLVYQSSSHEPLESRTAMAYWQNGKLYLHTSTQSITSIVPTMAKFVGIKPSEIVVIAEYCGGGFGSKYAGTPPSAIPALLSKKTGRPVMMRISREEEHHIGRGRAGLHMRAKIGFRKDGRITAMDLFLVMDNGPYARQGDHISLARCAAAQYQPLNMRYRGMAVLTNTPMRLSMRGPGGVQQAVLIEPLISKAARKLGIDDIEIRKINAPQNGSVYGPKDARTGSQTRLTSAYVREALDKGAELFNWTERKKRNGQRRGTKVTGVGVAVGNFNAGPAGYDGLLLIRPDGKVSIYSGCGNLGTLSVHDTARTAAEFLNVPWEQCEVVWGRTDVPMPWSSIQGGSSTTRAHTAANYAVAMDAKQKLQEIAAKAMGGSPDSYDVGNGRVFRKGNPTGGLTFAQAATKAIELGGKYDGHELPDNINAFTKESAKPLAGKGLVAVAKDVFPRRGDTRAFVVGFAEVEVDLETGEIKLVDYLSVGDVGIIVHPHGLEGQLLGGAVQGIGQVVRDKWVFDQEYGVPLARRFYQTRPTTILDLPLEMKWAAVELPDPETPVGAKGVGEAAKCGGAAAIRCAIAAAVGDDLVRRTPISSDMILNSLEAGRRVDAGLVTHV